MKTRSRTREPKSDKAPAQRSGGLHLASARSLLSGRAETQSSTTPSFAQNSKEPHQDADSTPLWMNINFSELPLDSDWLPDNALLELAIAGTRTALPQLATLETCFGVSLANIAVYSNPATRKALERFNAEAAVYRGQILLREPTPPLFTLAHEIAHILQFDATEAQPSEVILPATAAVESEAESLASRVERRANSRTNGIPFAPLTAEAKLSGDVVALRSADRTRPATANESATATPAAESSPAPGRSAPAPERQTELTPESERRPRAAGEASQTPGVDAEATGFGELPTVPEPGVTAEQVAARAEQVATAQAALDNAEASPTLMDAFVAAPPTIKAQVSGDLGNRFTSAMHSETQTIQENTPAVEAEMNGNTPVAAGTITSPDATTVELEPVPPEPAPDAETVVGTSVQNEEDAERNTSLVGRIAAAGGNPLALERLRAQLEEQSLNNVQTTDPTIVTSPGEPPAVPLQGETDPQRYQNQLDEGSRQGREALALQTEQALALPGVERVQLADVHESLPLGEVAAPIADDAASPEGAQQYLQLNMPAEVQTAFDDIAGPSMQQSQVEAQTQIQQAARDRDQQHQIEVQKAETETAKAQREADTAQRNHVSEARTQIETKRRETLDGQQAAVEQMETDAELQRDAERQEFDRQAQEKQGEIDGKYADAEADAEAKVREGEAEAEAERQRKEREAEDQSWWEAALDFITDLFDALVSFINKVFDAVRSAINGLLNVLRDAVIGLINEIASALKGLIRAFGEILKGLVQTLLGDLFPELAAKLTKAIDSAVEIATSAIDAAADALKNAVNFIVETLRAGINALLNVFQGALNAALALARAALTGDWEAFFLQLFEATCRVAGIDPESIYAFIGRARETIDIIVNDPGQFVSNIFDAVLGGFRLFGENFLTHLQRSVIEWLTGTLGSAGITLPERFDLMGVISLVAQILGLTWDNLRQRIVRVVGERGVQVIEFVAGYVQTLIEGGWSALWERIQNDLASLRDMVLDQLKNFIVERIITAALTRLATMFNPVGALVNLILAAYQFYTFVRDQMERIARVVSVVAEMIGNIARGVLGPAMQAVETVLAGLLTLALDLLARLLNLGNVGARVREILESVQASIWRAIDRLIEQVLATFRGGATSAAQPGEAQQPVQPTTQPETALGDAIAINFRMDDESHSFTVAAQGGRVAVLMASERQEDLAIKKRNFDNLLAQYKNLFESQFDSTNETLDFFVKVDEVKAAVDAKIQEILAKTTEQLFANATSTRRRSPAEVQQRRAEQQIDVIEQARRELAEAAQGLEAVARAKGLDGLSPLHIERWLEEKWRQTNLVPVQQKITDILQRHKPPIIAALPGSTVNYRGSLASGWKGPHKVAEDNAAARFNPQEFDCDAFIQLPNPLWRSEFITPNILTETDPSVFLVELRGRWAKYDRIRSAQMAIVDDLRREMALPKSVLRGYRRSENDPSSPKFSFKLEPRSTTEVQQSRGQSFPQGAFERAGFPETERQMQQVGRQVRRPEDVVQV